MIIEAKLSLVLFERTRLLGNEKLVNTGNVMIKQSNTELKR